MAMDPMDREPNLYNRDEDLYETEARSSNTLAYLIAGLVIALGLLAFLFYNGGRHEPTTTGSTPTQTEPNAAPEPPTAVPATPMSPNANPTAPNQ